MTSETSRHTFESVVAEDWKRILLSSIFVVFVFGGVDVLGKMHPGSPWLGLMAGVPTGLLSAYFISSADMGSFLQYYSQTSLCLTISTVVFAMVVAAQGTERSHAYIPCFILLWFLLNAALMW